VSETDLDRDLDRPTNRLGGVGLRHALVLVVAFVTPGAYAVMAMLGSAFDGFPTVFATAVTVGAALLGAVFFGITPSPSLLQLFLRGLGLLGLAVVVRLFTPSLTEALSDIGWQLTGTFAAPYGRVFLAVAAAHAAGHGVTARVAVFADGPRTRIADREGEQHLFTMWLVSVIVTVVAIGVAAGAAGLSASVLGLAGVLLGGVTIAHLRSVTPHPGGRRAPIVVPAARLRQLTIGGAVGATAIVAVAVVLSLPPAVTEASPRLIAWLTQVEFDPDDPRFWSPGDERQISEGNGAGELVPQTPIERERGGELEAPPPWPYMLVAAIIALAIVAYWIREDRWRHLWSTIWGWLRRRRRPSSGSDDDLEEVDPLGTEEVPRRRRGRLDRFRPRPRDPRGAILHDYLRAERTLAREDLGRERFETPLEHAGRLGLADEHHELAHLASVARYGREDPPTIMAERSRELARHVVRHVRQRSAGSTEESPTPER
jgi:hypothetical protein